MNGLAVVLFFFRKRTTHLILIQDMFQSWNNLVQLGVKNTICISNYNIVNTTMEVETNNNNKRKQKRVKTKAPTGV